MLVVAARLSGNSLHDPCFTGGVLEAIYSTGITVAELASRDFPAALRYVRKGLDMEDALHLAVAARTGCDSIVANDRGFEPPGGLGFLSCPCLSPLCLIARRRSGYRIGRGPTRWRWRAA